MFRDQTSDLTYSADITLFLHAISGRLSLTVTVFMCQCLAFYCFKCYFGSFSRCKIAFSPNIVNPKRTEQDQIHMKFELEKNIVFRCESRRAGRSLIIVNKGLKETENFIFSVEDQILLHSWTPKLLPLVKILFLVFIFGEIKFDLTLKNQVSPICCPVSTPDSSWGTV